MKTIGILLLSFFIVPTTFSQAFEKGSNFITLGFGLDPYGKANKYNAGFGYKHTSLGPIILAYEHGITDLLGIGRIGVGGAVAQSFYTSKSYYTNQNYEYKSSRSRTSLALRAAYHFDFGVEKMDVYAGVGGAIHVYSDTDRTDNPFDTKYNKKSVSIGGGPSVYGGIRYLFTPNFGVYAEAGYDISVLNGGLVFKF